MEFADLDAPLIGAFLAYLEHERGNSITTRNARLAAIHSLYRYATLRHPEDMATIARVIEIPAKRHKRTTISYLDENEIKALLRAPDRATWLGRRDHALLIGAILAHLDFLDQQIEVLSGAIEVKLAPCAAAVDLLRTIPGIEVRTAQNVIAEIGTDMTQFPSADHLASWGGQCPGNHQSAGKRRSGKSRKGSKWLNQALKEAAMAAPRTNDSYLQALYRRKKSQLGHARALGAVKHSILCAMWHMLTTGELYRDLGGDYYQRRDPERQTRRLVAQLERLGHTVTLQETAIAA